MARAITRVEISKKKRKVFLKLLAETGGNVKAASEAVGYANTSFLMKFKKEDEDFAEEWEEAVQAGAAILEAEILRRGIDGVLEPVFYKGKVVGYKTVYSDPLLLAAIKKVDPGYRDARIGGSTNINFGVAILPMTAKDDDDWENRAIEMHSDQKVIELEAKPIEGLITKVTRGD